MIRLIHMIPDSSDSYDSSVFLFRTLRSNKLGVCEHDLRKPASRNTAPHRTAPHRTVIACDARECDGSADQAKDDGDSVIG